MTRRFWRRVTGITLSFCVFISQISDAATITYAGAYVGGDIAADRAWLPPSDSLPATPPDALPATPPDTLPTMPPDALPDTPPDTLPDTPSDVLPTPPSDALPATPPDALPDKPSATYPQASPDSAEQEWVLGSPQGGEVLEEDGEWLHFKSGAGNDNGGKPALMVSNTYTDVLDGVLSFQLKPASPPAETRFGVYVRYQNPKNAVFVGYDKGGWFWQIYDGGSDPWYTGTRFPAPEKDSTAEVHVTFEQDKMDVSIDGDEIFTDVDISGVTAPGKIAFKAGTFGTQHTDVRIKDISLVEEAAYTVSGSVQDEDNAPVSGAIVSAGKVKTTTDENGVFQLSLKNGTHFLIAAKSGYRTSSQEVTVEEGDQTGIVLGLWKSSLGDVVVITSSDMEVTVDENFPRVVSYKYYDKSQDKNQGKTFSGQEELLDKLRINGKDVTPTVQSTVSGDHVTYRMEAVDEANGIDAVITAEFRVVDNTLEFNITEIEDKKIVKTIEIPNHNLISVTSLQEGAQLAGAEMSVNTHKSGDNIVDINGNFPVSSYKKKGYMYAFLSTHELSAGLWSNSENTVNGDWQRVTQTAVTKDGPCTEVALMSTPWTYQRGSSYRKQDGSLELEDGTVLPIQELPSAKVVITGDVNEDNKVDWQDGAVEYRKIMDSPTGFEKVPELVAYRISMNFGSQAQNPFLMALDGVKKISLHTDGLGQSILLKGYGSEGHDSGHLNYADIGTRIGGAEDMKYLMERGKEYGATFGIHVNASETYPESKYFSEPLLKKNENGSYNYGWNWIDQGININADYDLKHGRDQRFKDLYDVLGGANNDLDFIYVDVWGNGQSGDNGTWASSQLAKEINGLGWRLGGEWGYAFENASTFQHWAADLTYGGYSLKGINSQITRFLRNHEKDSWVGNYPSYGGAAVAPLLGGYNMKDFEGWQGRSDYNAYITNLFEVDVPSKFIQHYQVSNLEYGAPVTMKDNGETYSWTPEMMVRLRDKENIHSLVIERMSNDYAGSKNAYMSRTMTYDGNTILEGREGDSQYLIPWYWDSNGGELAEDDRKLYHWNTNGGESTWELPEDWTGLSSVYVYKLTEYGKSEMQEVRVDGMTVTLSADAKKPYVVYKGEKDSPQMVWSEGMHVADSGFNSGSLDAWTITGAAESARVTKSQGSNNMLEISGNLETVFLTQELTELTPNTKYIAVIGVDNRSETSVEMEIDNGLGKLTSRRAPKSIARNYVKAYAHNTNTSTATVNNTSYFQNLLVFFETGEDVSSVTLTLKREGDEAPTYLDDIRIVENDSENFVSDTLFVQDFENMAQGIWPFVIGDVEGVEDNRTHLSEKHIPYTQSGWNGKVVSDVIQGNWSVKTNGLTQRQRLIYQTIPQNFMFQPGVDYVVSFDYEAGSDGTYALVYGDRPYEEAGVKVLEEMQNTVDIGRARNYSFTLHGSGTGQSWFGIYSTNKAADTRGVTDSGQINFNGYKDFMLDNLTIRVADSQKDRLREVIAKAERLILEQNNYTEESWKDFTYALLTANEVNGDLDADQERVESAVSSLEQAIDALVRTGISVSGLVTDTDGSRLGGIQVVLVTADGKQFTAYTDQKGSYSIAGAFFGENTVSIDHIGYLSAHKKLKTSLENQEMKADFVLEAAATDVYGTVTAAWRKVPGARVALILNGQEIRVVTTDDKGSYGFSQIPVKPYEIKVTKDGYDSLRVSAATTKYGMTRKDMMLQPTVSGPDYSSDFSKGTTLKVLPGNTNGDAVLSVIQNGGVYETQINFNSTDHSNVYDSAAPVFKNGEVEADITALTDAPRFGILLRAGDMNHRAYVGTGDSTNEWFAEHWGPHGNNYTGMYQGPALNKGVTVHMKAQIEDKKIKLWVNDELILNLTMNNLPMDAGFVGFNAKGPKAVKVSNIKVTSYDPPKEGGQNVVGLVLDQSGAAQAGASVKLKKGVGAFSARSNQTEYTAVTNQNGEYKFKGIPMGSYVLSAASDAASDIPVTVEQAPYYVLADSIVLGAKAAVLKSSLHTAVSRAGELIPGAYTAESWKVFSEALEAARLLIEDGQASQDQVDGAKETLLKAMDALRAAADKIMLNLTINAARTLSEELYTAESFLVLKEALEKAAACSADSEATQSAVDSCLKVLNEAVRRLVRKDSVPIEDTALRLQVKVVEQLMKLLDKNLYTDQSWQELQGALEHGISVLNAETGQEEVDAALLRLEAAVSGLELKPSPGGGSSESDNSSADVETTGDGVWKQNEKGWWYQNADGSWPKQEWKKIHGIWYYFNADGYMLEGWNLIHGFWYYLQPETGAMQTGWIYTDGKWYYLNVDGTMFFNTVTPDGYGVGPDGAWNE